MRHLEIDNKDRLPPPAPHADSAPWQQQRRWLPDWRSLAVLCGFVLLLLLILYWLFGRDLRSWIQYGEGDKWLQAALWIAFGYVALRAIISAAMRGLIIDQRGYKVPVWQATDALQTLAPVDLAYAERLYPNAAAVTISQAPPMPMLDAPYEEAEVLEDEPLDSFDLALANVPRMVDLEHIIDQSPGSMSIPLGTDHTGASRWLDLRKGVLHVGIFGSTGAGKDNLMESWFLALTKNNTPDRIQFAVLDGKGHWMQPRLNALAHMWLPPAGGIGDEGQRALEQTLKAIQSEAARRGKLVFGADCDSMEMYCQKTGQTMPYLVVIISDVMGNIEGEVDRLLVDLVSKARALGIRVFVSMQTPTKQNTQWRSNLSTAIAAQMQQGSNDGPALGLKAADMLYPPSRLPDPQSRPGLFSVRSGRDQFLIQSPLVRKPFLAQSIAELPQRQQPIARPVVSAAAQADSAVSTSMPVPGAIVYPPNIKSKNAKIAWLLRQEYKYRQIEAELNVSHQTISQVKKAMGI